MILPNHMRLIITRHGETEENRKGILQGSRIHGTLSDLGKEQAKKLAKRLATEHIDVIYTSDLDRARHTTEEIASHHPEAKLIATKGLREVDVGSLTGMLLNDVDWKNPPADHEGDQKLFERSKKFILSLAAKHKGQTVLCVAHGRINAAMIAALTGHTHERIDQLPALDNTSVNILEMNEQGQWTMHLFNCIAHLEEGTV